MTSKNSRLSLDEVLDQFFLMADKLTPNLVLQACEAYPEYREEIFEYATLRVAHEALPEPHQDTDMEVSEEEVSLMQSFVLNRLYALDSNRPSDNDIANARIVLSGLSGGKQLRVTSQAIGLGRFTGLLTKILSSRITNVPSRVIGELARHLSIDRSSLSGALGLHMTGSFSYKSVDKPSGFVTESWEQAIQSLSATEEERVELLSLQERKESL